MTKHFNAVDENGLYHISKKQEAEQTKYLDSLPRDEQIKLAAKASGMSVVHFLNHISALHGDMIDAEEGLFDEGPIPYREPIIIEYLKK